MTVSVLALSQDDRSCIPSLSESCAYTYSIDRFVGHAGTGALNAEPTLRTPQLGASVAAATPALVEKGPSQTRKRLGSSASPSPWQLALAPAREAPGEPAADYELNWVIQHDRQQNQTEPRSRTEDQARHRNA